MKISEVVCDVRDRLIEGGFDHERAEEMAQDAFRALLHGEPHALDMLDETAGAVA